MKEVNKPTNGTKMKYIWFKNHNILGSIVIKFILNLFFFIYIIFFHEEQAPNKKK